MDWTGILDNASRLKKSSLYKVTISNEVREILFELNSKIRSNHDAGMTRAELFIPINFKQIDDSVSNEELQTAIYYTVAMELEKKGYRTTFKLLKDRTLLKTSWTVKADTKELAQMQKKLKELCE